MPLTSVVPNRSDQSLSGRAPYSRVEELGQSGTNISRSGSEPDSLLDLYRSNGSTSKPRPASNDNEIPENMYRPEDPEGWIHRDKLAKIESEELQAAGINLSSARRGRSKSGKRDTSRGRKSEESSHSGPTERREEKKPRLSEPVQEETDDDRARWDIRSPEEIAEDSFYAQPSQKKSSSRIPVMTSSPHGIPADLPVARKRTISNSMSPDDGTANNKVWQRRDSNISQEAAETAHTPTPKIAIPQPGSKASSPTKEKRTIPSPTTATSARKVTPTSLRKPPTVTKNNPTSPTSTTRNGDAERPRTAVNRPEGDPPWLATMYKPDPRLPPDQQIIPTHARKQQQAQWADDGSVPKTYDRDFTPLAVHQPEELAKRDSLPPTSPVLDKDDRPQENQSWPLKPMSSVRSANSNRPGTSGSITGQYSTMPKVQPSPVIQQSPRMGTMPSPRIGAAPSRLQEQRAEAEEKDDGMVKKGCCCIVM